ncbi:MAG: xanthine dehydrogenase family protein subunit M [Eubacteriales bacterium]|jgi:CO/xanthine dehydrogenase FAD-binding subunit|nr:xanthine dehydrogenase family protein subunit M [Eubacteriales bacterium]
MLPEFDLLIPKTLDEALTTLAERGNEIKVVAGGTDVYVSMHGKYQSFPAIMDIKHLQELKEFSFAEGKGAVIGALTTHHTLDRSEIIRAHYPALQEGASQVGSVQIRHRGTIGGNICNAVPSADTLGPLLVLDAKAVTISQQGRREIPLKDFFAGPKRTVIRADELLEKILLPDNESRRSAYIKFTRRNAMDLALLGASASLRVDKDGLARDVRISLTTCAPTPMRALHAEQVLEGKIPSEKLLKEAGLAASREASPRTSWRCTEEYRRENLKAIVPRVIATALARAREGVGIQ